MYKLWWNRNFFDDEPDGTRKWKKGLIITFCLLLLISRGYSQTITPGVDPELIIQSREIAPLPILKAQKTALQKQADTLASRIYAIDTSPATVVQSRITDLAAAIDRCPERPVKVAGRISMNQHLRNIKAEIEKNPSAYISAERARLNAEKTIVDADLATVESDIALQEGAK